MKTAESLSVERSLHGGCRDEVGGASKDRCYLGCT